MCSTAAFEESVNTGWGWEWEWEWEWEGRCWDSDNVSIRRYCLRRARPNTNRCQLWSRFSASNASEAGSRISSHPSVTLALENVEMNSFSLLRAELVTYCCRVPTTLPPNSRLHRKQVRTKASPSLAFDCPSLLSTSALP